MKFTTCPECGEEVAACGLHAHMNSRRCIVNQAQEDARKLGFVRVSYLAPALRRAGVPVRYYAYGVRSGSRGKRSRILYAPYAPAEAVHTYEILRWKFSPKETIALMREGDEAKISAALAVAVMAS